MIEIYAFRYILFNETSMEKFVYIEIYSEYAILIYNNTDFDHLN